MVRTNGGRLNGPFLDRGLVALGWDTAGPVEAADREAIRSAIGAADPGISGSDARNGANVLARFAGEVSIGDRVLIYDPSARTYTAGRVTSDYRHVPGDPLEAGFGGFVHRRDVEWTGEIPRDELSEGLQRSLMSMMTLFRLKPDQLREVEALLVGDPAAPHAALPGEPEEGEEAGEGDTEGPLDAASLEEQARQRIADRVAALGPEEMEHFVAGLLRALGYFARVSPTGPDRGSDILATPDPLGLEDPRIHVEVKHRRGKIDAPTLRGFLGGRRGGDRGIFVSTEGFTREARYEADRAEIPLRLIDADELVRLLIANYRDADETLRAMVPLRPIWWPAD